jgi:hypothetical protein
MAASVCERTGGTPADLWIPRSAQLAARHTKGLWCSCQGGRTLVARVSSANTSLQCGNGPKVISLAG